MQRSNFLNGQHFYTPIFYGYNLKLLMTVTLHYEGRPLPQCLHIYLISMTHYYYYSLLSYLDTYSWFKSFRRLLYNYFCFLQCFALCPLNFQAEIGFFFLCYSKSLNITIHIIQLYLDTFTVPTLL